MMISINTAKMLERQKKGEIGREKCRSGSASVLMLWFFGFFP